MRDAHAGQMICSVDNEMVFILVILTVALLFWFCVFVLADWGISSWKRRIDGIVMFLSFVGIVALGAVIVTAMISPMSTDNPMSLRTHHG